MEAALIRASSEREKRPSCVRRTSVKDEVKDLRRSVKDAAEAEEEVGHRSPRESPAGNQWPITS